VPVELTREPGGDGDGGRVVAVGWGRGVEDTGRTGRRGSGGTGARPRVVYSVFIIVVACNLLAGD
jgi:hypothetical protein